MILKPRASERTARRVHDLSRGPAMNKGETAEQPLKGFVRSCHQYRGVDFDFGTYVRAELRVNCGQQPFAEFSRNRGDRGF